VAAPGIGSNDDAAVSTAHPAGRTRTRAAVALLVVGMLVASVPGLAVGDEFLSGGSLGAWVRLDDPGQGPRPAGTATWSIQPAPRWRGFRVSPAPPEDGSFVRFNAVRSAFWSVPTVPPPLSMTNLVRHEAGWTAAALALVVTPLLFAWWRRRGASFGRGVGIACSLAGGAAVGALVLEAHARYGDAQGGVWWTVPLGALLMGAAFVVAPAPGRALDD
jgi:hypothetical protein